MYYVIEQHARGTKIDDSMIRNWRKKKDAVAKQPKGQRTGIVKFPALETTLTEWIVNQRECSRAVTIVMI